MHQSITESGTCPSCGRCRECGQPAPSYQPMWVWYPWPYSPTTTVVPYQPVWTNTTTAGDFEITFTN